MQPNSIKLHDIKPLMPIEDYSLYYFIVLSIVAIGIVVGIIFLLVRFLRGRKRYNQRKDYFQKIVQLDLNDSKKTAYDLTRYGALFSEDSTRHKEMYKNLVERLAPYKYKKDVDGFDDEVRGYIELYKGMIDV